ncbi:MAG TPA: YifB family Mg chelatase-like AAA ATPase [Myxococcota bacterium]|nr:YifB family Mg chelatase-like AAA ATPase [Myxococcota bacterium]
MSRIVSASLFGVDGVAVEVEVRVSSQLPRVDIVGLPAAAVRESAARVRAAIAAVGHRFPERRVTVNLAPADLRKTGASLDLAIAIGVLAASGAIEPDAAAQTSFVGELALDGRLRPLRGALALALAARDGGCKQLIAPAESAAEAALAPDLDVRAAHDLGGVLRHLLGAEALPRAEPVSAPEARGIRLDLADVRGQENAKRALEIAAAGGHALLLRGSPGSGKTMLAARLEGLLPELDTDEALEVTRIHGAAGSLRGALARERPFRAPHHTASTAGLLGGGNPPRPGEVSLAHRGVLFLDELPEFERRALESLRQVLEERRVVVARASASCVFPADFQLVAAMNPCPCGWRGAPQRDCRCDDAAVARYGARVSGPLLDRIDLHVSVMPVAWHQLDAPMDDAADTRATRERVAAARGRQLARGTVNARLRDAELDAAARATTEAMRLLGRAFERLGLSARAARRALRVARTIADLAGEARVEAPAMAEALAFRGDPQRP